MFEAFTTADHWGKEIFKSNQDIEQPSMNWQSRWKPLRYVAMTDHQENSSRQPAAPAHLGAAAGENVTPVGSAKQGRTKDECAAEK